MTTKNNIVLGFDFGMQRIGVAVGQTITKTARPLEVIKAQKGQPQWKEIDKLIAYWQPDLIVVGIPLNMDGTEQPMTEHAKNFVAALKEHFKIPIFGIDERLTTKEARDKIFKKGGYKALQNKQIDCVAAQIILETWFMQEE